MSRYGFQSKFQAKNGNGRALADVLLEAANLVSGAGGCHLYLVSLDKVDHDVIWIYEVWDSKEEHDSSLSMPGVRTLIGKAMPLLDGPPTQQTELEVLGGAGMV